MLIKIQFRYSASPKTNHGDSYTIIFTWTPWKENTLLMASDMHGMMVFSQLHWVLFLIKLKDLDWHIFMLWAGKFQHNFCYGFRLNFYCIFSTTEFSVSTQILRDESKSKRGFHGQDFRVRTLYCTESSIKLSKNSVLDKTYKPIR